MPVTICLAANPIQCFGVEGKAYSHFVLCIKKSSHDICSNCHGWTCSIDLCCQHCTDWTAEKCIAVGAQRQTFIQSLCHLTAVAGCLMTEITFDSQADAPGIFKA